MIRATAKFYEKKRLPVRHRSCLCDDDLSWDDSLYTQYAGNDYYIYVMKTITTKGRLWVEPSNKIKKALGLNPKQAVLPNALIELLQGNAYTTTVEDLIKDTALRPEIDLCFQFQKKLWRLRLERVEK